MARLTRELLERYHDGELSPSARRRVEALLAESPEDRASLDRLQRLGDLLRTMSEDEVAATSFEGFGQRVMNGLDRAPRPRIGERLRVWLGEFFEHRKVVWIPTAAVVTAAACAMLIFAFVTAPGPQPGGVQPYPDRSLVAEAQPGFVVNAVGEGGSEIVSVNFGEASGFTTSVQNERGEVLGVVWINE